MNISRIKSPVKRRALLVLMLVFCLPFGMVWMFLKHGAVGFMEALRELPGDVKAVWEGYVPMSQG